MQPDLLIERLQQKDERAFAKIYELYSENIFGVIHVIVKDPAVADEVMQDVFLKVWDKAESYTGNKGRFFTWLLNIARNAAIDKLRSKAYKNSQKNEDVETFAFFLENDENLNGKTDSIGIAKLVNKLKPICKKVIDLLFFKGFTQNEAADTLDIPLGTVKSRNRNCLKKLREEIE
jgi:RNA polymerase sigma-70 factor (ECF subfamily)